MEITAQTDLICLLDKEWDLKFCEEDYVKLRGASDFILYSM